MPSSTAPAFTLGEISLTHFFERFSSPVFLLSASPLASTLLPTPKTPPRDAGGSFAEDAGKEREIEPERLAGLQQQRRQKSLIDDARTITGGSDFDFLSIRRNLDDTFTDSRQDSRSESAVEDEGGLTSDEQILKDAFEPHEVDSQISETKFDPLVGGDQLSHDPTRTAEGAVTALHERVERVKRQEEAVESEHQREEAEGVEREKAKAKWYVPSPRVSEGGKAGGAGRLEELLRPVWENKEFTKLVGKKVSSDLGSSGSKESDVSPSLNLLDLLSRKEGQSLISLLTTALAPSTTGDSSTTATLHLSFPINSVHNHVPSIAARRNVPLFPSPDPSPSLTEVADTTLELAASYLREHDLLVLVGTLRNLPTPVLPLPTAPLLNATRPPLHSYASTMSSVSSVSTVLPGSQTVLSPPPPTKTSPMSPNAPLTAVFGVRIAEPLQGTHDDARPLPQGFLVEPKKKRRSHRVKENIGDTHALGEIVEPVAGGEQEISREEEIAEGVAARSRRESESSNEEDLDTHDLDNLREMSRTGSMNGEMERPTVVPDDPNQIRPSPPSTPNEGERSPLESSLIISTPHDPSAPKKNTFARALAKTPVGRLILNKDWSATPLGALEKWSPELKMLVRLILASPMRESIWWGDEFVLIYNDAYVAIAGTRHPAALGSSGSRAWSDVWDAIGPLCYRCIQGETISEYDAPLSFYRQVRGERRLMEEYHCYAFVPVSGESGVFCLHNPSFDTTARVIAERRLETIRCLVQATATTKTIEEFTDKAIRSLSDTSPYDIPFFAMYSCDQSQTPPPASQSALAPTSQFGARSHNPSAVVPASLAQIRLSLAGSIGFPSSHPSIPANVILDLNAPETQSEVDSLSSTGSTFSTDTASLDGTTIWPFKEACTKQTPVFVEELGRRGDGREKRGWEEPVRNAVVIPILEEDGSGSVTVKSVIVVGLNPRRPWDDVYATFLNLLARQLSSGLSQAQSAEQDARKRSELLALDSAKTQFFSNISHELRTPLTLILGPLGDVLSAKPTTLDPTDREKLVTVQKNSVRLLNMVNTLLDFSRLEGGKMEAKYRAVRLGTLTSDLASLFRSAIERGGVEFVVDCQEDPSDGPPIYLATDFWEKIVFNLIGNAFKYCLEGTISVLVRFTDDSATLSVSDTGCGIAENELSRIFERFHRVETVSRTYEGTGIGLALTLELVKAIGGTLEVVSQFGKGSTFSVRLPRGSRHLDKSKIASSAAEPLELPPRAQYDLSIVSEASSWPHYPPVVDVTSPPRSAPTSSISSRGDESISSKGDGPLSSKVDSSMLLDSSSLLNLSGSTVLLADDNDDLRRYIAGALAKAFKVVQVSNGQDALDYALRSPPALIVSDVQMPRLDGPGLLRALRSNPTTALIPIIFLSAHAGAEARVEALLQGADDYLVKPFQSRELLARVNVHLQLGKLRQALESRVASRTRDLVESEVRYRGLADRYSTLSVLSPVGIFMMDSQGTMTYGNPRFYDISGIPNDSSLAEWLSFVRPEDIDRARQVVQDALSDVSEHKASRNSEFRWIKGSYVQFEIRPFHETGSNNQGFVGAITDITEQKRLETLHIQAIEQRAIDAEENRRNQELFIDMASHELRNPLSGVWQNAEVVSGSLERILDLIEDIRSGTMPDEETLEDAQKEMQENIESVESIILCAAHQGRIADDILSVSKLSMGLLSINKCSFDVTAKMAEVLRIFEVECAQKQITLRLVKNRSISQLHAEYVVADPSRLAQILINFLTNSVKYTSDSKRREITVYLDACSTPPPPTPGSMRVGANATLMIPENQTPPAPSSTTSSATSTAIPSPLSESTTPNLHPLDPAAAMSPAMNSVWLTVSVKDSGKGLSAQDMSKLFERFSQANPKTDQYGGSGLGLFVSKKLVELHDGFIEVESTQIAGSEGSIFRFSIPASPSAAPPIGAPANITPAGLLTPVAIWKKKRGSSNESGTRPARLPTPTIEPRPSKPLDQPLHVLVVEDNLINQKVMQRQLKLQRFEVTVANHGQEALDILLAETTGAGSGNPIGIVLMDIEMPVMDGLTAIREIRRMEGSGELKSRSLVIAVTGNARDGQKRECIDSGFDEVAIKPYKMVELLATMERLIGSPVTA